MEVTATNRLAADLKLGTRAYHDDLEAKLDLLNSELSLARYVATLSRTYGFYRALENNLGTCEASSAWITSRFKSELRLIDLNYFKVDTDKLKLCGFAPDPATFAEVLGCLYVTEGATLGGQIIKRHVIRRLGAEAVQGCSFYSGYDEMTGPLWREFRTVLDSQPHNSRASTLKFAKLTFTTLLEWMSEGDLA